MAIILIVEDERNMQEIFADLETVAGRLLIDAPDVRFDLQYDGRNLFQQPHQQQEKCH